jgi:cohesin complex subunit SCC1
MFYSKFMFVKKGPLSKVWIAAHFQRKLTKTLVQGTDINISAKSILDPSTPLALRLSGQLLLGLVRIFQKKVRYLQEDCSEALTKMKMIFKPGAVDLPPESATAHSAQVLNHIYSLCSRFPQFLLLSLVSHISCPPPLCRRSRTRTTTT